MARAERTRLSMTVVLEAPIRFYRRFLSRALPRRCKYEPSCSVYALSALRSYGMVRGLVLTGWRVLRCNPLSNGGFDPVEAQTLFRSRGLGLRWAAKANRSLHVTSSGEVEGRQAAGACAEEHLSEVEA
jgi:putative membrane protein insertion efficiency factor